MSAQQLINALTLGGSYALLAIGLTLTWGVLSILNVAHIQFIAWGGLLAVWLSSWTGNAIVGVVLATLTIGVVGALLDQFPFRPVRRGGGGHYGSIVVGLALVAIFERIAHLMTKGRLYPFPRELIPTGSVNLGIGQTPTAKLVIVLAAIGSMLAVGWLLWRTRIGREIRAVASDAEAAEASGVNREAIYILSQGVAAALAGLAGALTAVATLSAIAGRGIGLFLKGFAASIIGGMGSVLGAAIGGFLLGFIDVLAIVYGAGAFRDGFAFLVIIIVLVVAPDGLSGVVSRLVQRARRPVQPASAPTPERNVEDSPRERVP